MSTKSDKCFKGERRLIRAERNAALEKQILDVALSPNMIRLAMLCGIVAYSTHCARSKTNVGPVQSALAYVLPTVGIPMIAADAGIRDKYALAAISAVSFGYVTGQAVQGWQDVGLIPSPSEAFNKLVEMGGDVATLPAEMIGNLWEALT